jgi:hypothetical protein
VELIEVNDKVKFFWPPTRQTSTQTNSNEFHFIQMYFSTPDSSLKCKKLIPFLIVGWSVIGLYFEKMNRLFVQGQVLYLKYLCVFPVLCTVKIS